MIWRVPKVLTCSDVQNTYPEVTDWWDNPARNAGLPVSEGRAGCPSPPGHSPRGRPSVAATGSKAPAGMAHPTWSVS